MNAFNPKEGSGIKLLIGFGVVVTIILIVSVVIINVSYHKNSNENLNVNGVAVNLSVNTNQNVNTNLNQNTNTNRNTNSNRNSNQNLNLNSNVNLNTNSPVNLNTNLSVEPVSCDEGKFYNYRKDYPGLYNDESDYACCDLETDCVYKGFCYGLCVPGEPPCSMADIDGDGVKGHYCLNDGSGQWRDCDRGASLCTKVSYCDLDNAWVLSGEQVDHGDYDADYGIEMCCGDDAGEYLIEKNGNYICCNSPDDTLNNYYNCQSSNGTD